MVVGFLFAIIAGSFVSVQNIFNSKVNEHLGTLKTTILVLGLGCITSFIIGLFFEGKQMISFENIKFWYWFSGLLGIGVVTCLVQGIRLLGPTYAISIALTSQLAFALLWDSVGILGLEKIPFTFKQLVGVIVIVGGILVFKWNEIKIKRVKKSIPQK